MDGRGGEARRGVTLNILAGSIHGEPVSEFQLMMSHLTRSADDIMIHTQQSTSERCIITWSDRDQCLRV